jgi:antitoxin MazE
MMEAIIQKWGDNLGIPIPPAIISEMSLKEGSSVEIEDRVDKIIIKPKQQYVLADMLRKIDETNIHRAIETGMPVGNEIW